MRHVKKSLEAKRGREGKKEREKERKKERKGDPFIPLQLSDLNPTMILSQMVAIIPFRIAKLRTLDLDLRQLDAR